MSGTDWAAIIVAVTGFVAALGKGVAWLVGFVTNRADKAVTDLEAERNELRARVKLLEETCRKNGVPLP